jgi:poly(3-hydroxyalkanoate) synthetase
VTAQLTGAAVDRADEARGAVPQDEGAALSTVETGEAVWRDTADRRTGSWWEAWATWVLGRSGAEVGAPAAVGSDRRPPLEPAPRAYVLDRVP